MPRVRVVPRVRAGLAAMLIATVSASCGSTQPDLEAQFAPPPSVGSTSTTRPAVSTTVRVGGSTTVPRVVVPSVPVVPSSLPVPGPGGPGEGNADTSDLVSDDGFGPLKLGGRLASALAIGEQATFVGFTPGAACYSVELPDYPELWILLSDAEARTGDPRQGVISKVSISREDLPGAEAAGRLWHTSRGVRIGMGLDDLIGAYGTVPVSGNEPHQGFLVRPDPSAGSDRQQLWIELSAAYDVSALSVATTSFGYRPEGCTG